MGAVPPEFLAKWQSYLAASNTVSWETAGLAAFTLAILGLWPRFTHKVPGPIVALILSTALAQALGLQVETIGTRFGGLPHGLPVPVLPDIPWRQLPALIRPATTVALLAAIESLLSAVVADGMIGGRHRSNMELIAQGCANIASPLFGGIPVTGAIARTATNIKSGGRTPVSGIVHAGVLALVLLFLGRWVALIPLCVLAAILVVVCYHMSEWRSFRNLLKSPRSDVAVLLTTFSLTVLVDLTVAVEVGMVLAAMLFMKRMAEVTNIDAVTRELDDDSHRGERKRDWRALPPGVELYDINGPFFFGAANKLGEVLQTIQNPPNIFILNMKNVPAIDATGLRALEDFQARCRRMGTLLILCGVHAETLRVISHADKRHAFDKIISHGGASEAIRFAESLLE
jgi:SulP family sulfate permease